MRSLLVTGGAGFIGSNFVRYWLANRPVERVVVLDALTYAGDRRNLPEHEALRFVHGDIRDTRLVEQLLRESAIEAIVHFAAESHVDRSISGPDAFIETNVVGTHSLLKAARGVWLSGSGVAHRFHHVSTDEVYGSLGPNDPAFHENTPYAPNSPYSASKAGSDHLVRAYHHTYGLDVTISNCSNNYGPYHFPEKLIPVAIVNILRGRAIPVYGDGRNVRDWLYVEDHCRALERILVAGRSGEVYNVGGRAEVENLALLRRLCAIADDAFGSSPELARRFPGCPCASGASSESLLQFVKDRPGHDRRYAIDPGKLSEELAFSPAHTLESGLRTTFDWFVRNEPWWQGRGADA